MYENKLRTFFFFFCFSLLKMTEISFVSTISILDIFVKKIRRGTESASCPGRQNPTVRHCPKSVPKQAHPSA